METRIVLTAADWHRVSAAQDVRFNDNGAPVAVLEDDHWFDL